MPSVKNSSFISALWRGFQILAILSSLLSFLAGCEGADRPITGKTEESLPSTAITYKIIILPPGPGELTWRIEFKFSRPVKSLTHPIFGFVDTTLVNKERSSDAYFKICDGGEKAVIMLRQDSAALRHLWGDGGGRRGRSRSKVAVFAPEFFQLSEIDAMPIGHHLPIEPPLMHLASGFVWAGSQDHIRRDGLEIVSDPALPGWIKERWYQIAQTSLEALAQRYQFTLSEKATLMALMKDGEKGEISLHGYTRNNAVLIHLRGQGLIEPSKPALQAVDINFMHELMHLIQERRTMSAALHARVPAFLLEGSAEAMALYQLERDGFWTSVQKNQYIREKRESCAVAMEAGPLAPQGSFPTLTEHEVNYDCGLIVFNAIAEKAQLSPLALWAAFEADLYSHTEVVHADAVVAFTAKVTKNEAMARSIRRFLLRGYITGLTHSIITQFEQGTL